MKKRQKLLPAASLVSLLCLVAIAACAPANNYTVDAERDEQADDTRQEVERNGDPREFTDRGFIQPPIHDAPEFPAAITSVNCPVFVNTTLTIDGHDFGATEGTVIVALRDKAYSCEIIEWSDTQVRCNLPDSMVAEFGTSPQEAVIWLRPARSSRPEGAEICLGCEDSTYYYSGEEGPRYVCTIQPLPCTGVDLVLNKIEVSRWGSLGCAAKVWISQVCDGETTVDSFYAFRTEGEVDQQIGWWIRAGWQGPTQQPLESGWLGMVCGTITGIVDYADAETEVSEENNECSVTIGEGQNSVAHTCVEFLENAH